MILGSWMNLVFNNYFQLLGMKINWILLIVIVMTFRYSKLTLPIIGIFAGLICDAHSHGIMGLYAISYFLTTLLVINVKKILYSNNYFAIGLIVSVMTIIEALLSLTILGWFYPDLEKIPLIINTTISLAIIHGFSTPVILKLIIWGENIFLKEVT